MVSIIIFVLLFSLLLKKLKLKLYFLDGVKFSFVRNFYFFGWWGAGIKGDMPLALLGLVTYFTLFKGKHKKKKENSIPFIKKSNLWA